MNVSLGKKWEGFVDAKVRSGDFQSASEVVREGLRLLEEKELLQRISISSLPELKRKLVEGIRSLDSGRRMEGERAFQILHQRTKDRRARG